MTHASPVGNGALPPLDQLIACPACDLLHRVQPVGVGMQARCSRCHTVLIAPRESSFVRVIALSATTAILMVGAVFFPFLEISAAGLHHQSSIFSTAEAFSEGLLLPLSLAVLMLIVLFPILRVLALIYTLWPLARGRRPWTGARGAFRLAERLQPWSMAEVFVIGTAVALVKISGIATVSLGPAFWAFCALVIVIALKDNFMCKWTIWQALDQPRKP